MSLLTTDPRGGGRRTARALALVLAGAIAAGGIAVTGPIDAPGAVAAPDTGGLDLGGGGLSLLTAETERL